MNKAHAPKRKRNSILLLMAAVLLVIVFIQSIDNDKKIRVSKIEWNRNNGSYIVAFTVENRTRRDLLANISIKATRSKYIGKAQVLDLVGEKTIKVMLQSGESRKIEEPLKLKFAGRADSITVNAWEPK